MNTIFSFARARSSMIFDARNSLRRWISVTFFANLVRNVASSIAVSPPPTTAISLLRKNAPSQVAQVETPCPRRCFSDSMPSIRADAPAATISVSVSYVSLPAVILNGRLLRSADVTAPAGIPRRIAGPVCASFSISSGPRMPSVKARKILDLRGQTRAGRPARSRPARAASSPRALHRPPPSNPRIRSR